ncbi:hypothetical protein [Olsenella uli]|uniref:hypothetical protein n=1 Tax=Olsenella uli TaxID=133926 RepID=UPI00325FBCE2
MNEQRRIDIEHLIADEENPRFEAVSTEEDALFSILEDQATTSGNKVLNLARDIAANGLNASELLIVSPIEGTDDYRVREGNRRVTAIKLSLDSSRIPAEFNKLVPQFEKFADAMRAHRVVNCCVCDDEGEIRRLLELRHGGEQDGVGTVKWNAAQKARFSSGGNQQSARALSLVEHLKEDYGQNELWALAARIPPTNLGRFITTPKVRQQLGIDVAGDYARYLGGHDDLLLNVLTIISSGVQSIYTKNDRVNLIEEAVQRIEPNRQNQQPLPFEKIISTVDVSNVSDVEPPSHSRVDEAPASIPGTAVDVLESEDSGTAQDGTNHVRRKPVSNNAGQRMFGQTLRPKGTKSNDIYRGIDWIDEQYLKHPDTLVHLLPILGISLRLLMETVAREYFASRGDNRGDNSLRDFLKDVAKPTVKKKVDEVGLNKFTLASEWIAGQYNFDAIFGKWAHGTLEVDRASLVRQSELVALIVKEIWS